MGRCFQPGRLALALLIAGLSSEPAGAYVRSASPRSGVAFTWMTECIPIQADLRGSQDFSIEEIDAVLAQSCANWSSRTDMCSNLRLIPMPASQEEEVAADSRPVLVFRDVAWKRPGGMPHDPSAIALTTVFHVSTPGRYGDATILDTDVEMNGVNFTFTTNPATGTARPGTTLADFENTLTHELGHVQGLAHTCWDRSTATPPRDDKGQPIQDCTDVLPQAVLDTTMYPFSLTANEISKRSISDDEVRGICEIYPSTASHKACFQRVEVGSFGCAVAPGGTSLFVLRALLLVALFLLIRRLKR